MGEKSRVGREPRKPKADKNKKVKGQTPPPRPATSLELTAHRGDGAKH